MSAGDVPCGRMHTGPTPNFCPGRLNNDKKQ